MRLELSVEGVGIQAGNGCDLGLFDSPSFIISLLVKFTVLGGDDVALLWFT